MSETFSECALLEHALGRLGIRAAISIGDQRNDPSIPSPQYVIHLTRTIPLQFLLQALTDLQKSSAVLMTTTTSSPNAYHEHIQIDTITRMINIQRSFQRDAFPRRQLMGIAWKLDRSPVGPPPSQLNVATPQSGVATWKTVHAILRGACRWTRRDFPAIAPAAAYFTGPAAHHRPLYELFKRLFDILFSLAAILITLPITLTVAALIKLYDRGPIFFVHQREGRHGKPFGCLKFRTMTPNAHQLQRQLRRSNSNHVDGPQFKMPDDPRITPLGSFLRKTNIDELPQFLNVLFGHMSVVGPRPSPFEENQLCPAWREARLSVPPGITGLWQISRSRQRGPSDFQEWILYDTQYVERRGFWLDLKIILLTIKELLGRGQ
ncbi:MAG: sugar transferase [Phycisphaerales bacterium]|nr:sugar transferase [Phycisphaerales bacterium]